ncbi:LacI family DNA-binding transcriptional regulator [Actinoplanes sp. NPDC024001]|uniref:LacI family DNA-binding transcriptional regulator n=1 Tax=Actinoplanes sp. NPDC024001 TaxID=3154598 RepID=UPI0033C46129
MTGRAVTLRDVAKTLGVSHTTVSNAYNRPQKLSDQLRQRILDTARELGYPGPDPLAAGLARRQVGALGVLFDEDLAYALTDPAALLFLQGVAGAGRSSALGLSLLPAPRSDEDAALTEEAVRTALVDGFVVYSVRGDHPGLLAARRRGIPLIVVDEPEPAGPGDGMFLGVDDHGGAYAAARHLTGLGHRRIGILVDRFTPGDRHGAAGPERQAAASYQVARQRLAGYLAGLADAGIPAGSVPVWECGGGTPEHAGAATQELLADGVTGILAMTDELARGVLHTAAGLRVDVPGELSVVGFDDIPEAARTQPPLTTVRQPLRDKGVLAVELLTRPGTQAPPRLPTHLIVRGTTGPQPASPS